MAEQAMQLIESGETVPVLARFSFTTTAVKDKDVRAKRFRQKVGRNAKTVELEALPVAELKRRVEEAIEELIDWERWDRQIMVQDVELASIAETPRSQRMWTREPTDNDRYRAVSGLRVQVAIDRVFGDLRSRPGSGRGGIRNPLPRRLLASSR